MHKIIGLFGVLSIIACENAGVTNHSFTDASVSDSSSPSDAIATRDAPNQVDAAIDAPIQDAANDVAPSSYSPPASTACRALANPGRGFFELSFPGAGGNYSKTCSFQNLQLRVTGGNFGVAFTLIADVSSQTGSYSLPANAFTLTRDRNPIEANNCRLCLAANGHGSLDCSNNVTAEFECTL